MAINKGNTLFTGTHDGLCGYFCCGKNIIRSASSLTGARVKKEAAFEGFRKSGDRMKEASPIAAALYKRIPKEHKRYSLYRLLTGEALKMIKIGIDKAVITDKLYYLYISPVLQQSIGNSFSENGSNTFLPNAGLF